MTQYNPNRLFRNSHLNTIYHSEIRSISDLSYVRERFELNDGDFIELDWSANGNSSLAVILHGLESNTQRPYMKGMAKALNLSGMDTLSMSFRGCGGQTNRLLRFYHSGDTGDLRQLLEYLSKTKSYKKIFLVGFSLGGNVLLKFLGEEGERVREAYGISKAAAVSAPLDLASACGVLDGPKNYLYRRRFLKKLEQTLERKKTLFPDDIDIADYKSIRTIKEYDDRYTARIHGFRDAEDYYEKASSKRLLQGIAIPVVVINALDDPFLGDECYPDEADMATNKNIEWILPRYGGHVGFSGIGQNLFWHEKVICGFFED